MRARDRAGNVERTPARVRWSVVAPSSAELPPAAQGIQGLLVTDRGAAPEHGATLPVRIKEIDVEKRRFSLVMA